MPVYAVFLILKSLYYPFKDLFGEAACYVGSYVELFLLYLAQFQTFFITLYRYICLFHDDMLFSLSIHPKFLAKIMATSLFIISFFTSFFIIFGTELVIHLESCLGNYWLQYDSRGHEVCGSGSVFVKVACKFSFVLYFLLSSNVPEAFLLYKCFKKIGEQTESVQEMIDTASYQRRRR